ncbi:hypothetical protein [Halorussus aquaticus]|uniref:Uncharacterized protein n=1 Tax=Halorussus aquaticus TaxID=2953748 RepID=A0ABD5Q8F9_9EURY|nr:hypothetical protein [Halorussus aquaticus]
MKPNQSGFTPPDRRPQTNSLILSWFERYADYGTYGLLAGTVLCLAALFTNPVPDPSFPWFTVPAEFRLSYAQPRIEHWPVTYTLGIWLWVFCLPSMFLRGYRRYGSVAGTDPSVWLTALPVTFMLGVTTYCRFFWPKLHPASWNAPSYTFVCWGYCSSYVPLWSNLAYAVALFGVGTVVLAYRRSKWVKHALATFGVLALPLGIPVLYEAYRRHAIGGESR